MTGSLAVAEAAAVLGERGRPEIALGPYTTYRVGGRAALFVEAENEGDLALVADAVSASGVPVLVVGKGSNLLVADAGWPGLAVRLGRGFELIERQGERVSGGGAVLLPVLARRSAAWSLTGLEWAVGVPGSVGGAVRMNAGGHGSDVSRTLESASVWELAGSTGDHTLGSAELDLAYRRSSISSTQVVVSASFALAPGHRESSEAEIADIVRWRREHQPGGANAGSVFSNPPGDSAGRLVEVAGLKGHRRGSAFVSPKHANFFQADDGGSADDVRELVLEVQALVEERTGVRLEPELRMLGFPVTAD